MKFMLAKLSVVITSDIDDSKVLQEHNQASKPRITRNKMKCKLERDVIDRIWDDWYKHKDLRGSTPTPMPISLLELYLSISFETRNKKQWAKHQDRSADNIPLATDPAKLSPSRATPHTQPLDVLRIQNKKRRESTRLARGQQRPPRHRQAHQQNRYHLMRSESLPFPPDSSIPATAFTALFVSTAVGEHEENEIPEDPRVADYGLSNVPVIQNRITMGNCARHGRDFAVPPTDTLSPPSSHLYLHQ
ncbi:hypothetical protein FIBSPDRAFT_950526 [Athelia psychrophila]|uniref:Uncharacterized protein n=1 Tax=Athelia psychrophila TaxID=1759441 RepID=A0A166NLZ4_9AGAM|nr:hypothetical protein FIBSPDRAFT_950526 [Fibularhizoctonia sp. CBS 109695]